MNGAVRDDTLLQLRVTTMFVQKLDATLKKMKSRNELQANVSTQDAVDVIALQAIAAFISKSLE
ncbi:hypothetical protein TanjilG_07548 [Lupinus angustifolius]|uniref:Uncharacterized protein n=1 Tax=Lupinus angustifolius TaxID=3871 RepID=A0A1J7GV94_LUPAN|nr:hypothetical protein TanjilG_07548 [Lupinus angustifolius]